MSATSDGMQKVTVRVPESIVDDLDTELVEEGCYRNRSVAIREILRHRLYGGGGR